MTFQELVDCLFFADQTIGCSHCDRAHWAEHYTDDPMMFHKHTCPLYGRRDVHESWFNIGHFERKLGFHVGAETIKDWKAVAQRYCQAENKASEHHFKFLHQVWRGLQLPAQAIVGLDQDEIEKMIIEKINDAIKP